MDISNTCTQPLDALLVERPQSHRNVNILSDSIMVSQPSESSTKIIEPIVKNRNSINKEQQTKQKHQILEENPLLGEEIQSRRMQDSSFSDTIETANIAAEKGDSGPSTSSGVDSTTRATKNKSSEKAHSERYNTSNLLPTKQHHEPHHQHHHHHHLLPQHHNEDEEETDIIGDLVGHFGKWQFLMTILLSLFQVPNTFHISSSIYQAANKNFWCKRPDSLNTLPVDIWRNISNSLDNCFQSNTNWSQWPSYNFNSHSQLEKKHFEYENILSYLPENNHNLNTSRKACTAWEYEINDNVGNTWTSEWDLVCDKEYLKNVAEMFFLLGVATGGIISGYLSDKFGRKTMLFISAVLQTTFGLALYFPHSFELYITLRALLGLVSVSVTYAGLILAIEYVDGKWRTIAGMYNLFPLPISYMMISGIAYLTQDYKNLQLCIGIPGIFLCFLWFVVPESPRWLLVKGRIDEVKLIIEAAAKFNKKVLPTNYDLELKPLNKETPSEEFTLLFRSGYLRRISICFLCIWFTMNLVYYGLILNMSSFGGNVYLNSALAGLVEIPAIAIAMYIITKVGKKWLFCATFFCAGIACCCAAITEGIPDLLWLKITFLMIGKFTISAGNTIMPVYTAELYPTAIRNAGVGACNVAAGVALILTPYLSLLTKIEAHLLMTLLTCWSLFGGFVILFLPETMASHAKKHPPEEKC